MSVVLNVEASAEEETDAEERIDLIEKYLRQGVLTCRAFIDEKEKGALPESVKSVKSRLDTKGS